MIDTRSYMYLLFFKLHLTFMSDWRNTEADGCGKYLLFHAIGDPPVYWIQNVNV